MVGVCPCVRACVCTVALVVRVAVVVVGGGRGAKGSQNRGEAVRLCPHTHLEFCCSVGPMLAPAKAPLSQSMPQPEVPEAMQTRTSGRLEREIWRSACVDTDEWSFAVRSRLAPTSKIWTF